MSASLLRKGLELLSDDIKDVSKGKKKKQQQQTPSSATVMELVSTKRQGVTKQVKRLQGRLGPGKSKATVKDKRIKSAVEEFRKKQGKSQMSANLKYFMATGYKATDSDTLKILSHNSGRQSRNRPERLAKKPKEPKSLFTEKEFQQFQKEYFGRTVEEKK
ncbi:active regulator of SIRT1 [Seriola lalandi dorsalis]|uniref:Active regulator of SIRT1 n=1 Tax=Seriola lalandi dorsalis TaxID=1841481 RepID=A0A3B4YDN5_SERLL|nr:active regulator of SIRT1 [Seriola lalandi dorsalis]XP_056227246.1 ribosomal protein S19 binding protein 1 [Seriola aureovittata]